ncbi:nitrilase-related carbon-nitrogen hydrolase, partial [Nocardioides sp.]|uniref:nitrilase-related carbon-nitrogen hydrolase n=1 Tax=Nocardioides sp. TaxID=35761 RepID=UPI002F41E161
AEVILVPAAWVAGPRKVEHWTTLLRARAIENTVYVVGVGQPAPRYSGHSTVIGPLGDVVVEGGDDAQILTTELDLAAVAQARRTNPSLANRRL